MAGAHLLILLAILLHSGVRCAPMAAAEGAAADATADAPKPRVALLHMHDGAWFFQRLGSLTLANKRRYAARWRYDMVSVTPEGAKGVLHATDACLPGQSPPCYASDKSFDIDHSRAATFGKIALARAACVGRKDHWLFWSDADAMVVNQSIPLESIIDDGYDLIYAYDWLMLNAGMLFMKCSDWTDAFLKQVYDAREFDNARALDQSSFQSHLDKLPPGELAEHVKILPKHAMNVYLEEYRPGDFLMHMAGKLYEATEKGLWAVAQQFDVLSRVDDVRDVASFFSTVHVLNYYSGTCNRNVRPSEHACSPTDDRRIRLREPLGAMSTPDRYRHVGLRYYWMQHWKDKYDVPGWNRKKESMPIPVDGHRHESDILAEELKAVGEREVKLQAVRKTAWAAEGEAVVNAQKVAHAGEHPVNQTNGKVDGESGTPTAMMAVLTIGALAAGAAAGVVVFIRKQRRAMTKLQ